MKNSIVSDYLGMSLEIDPLDQNNITYFKYCNQGNFHLQKCNDCNMIRYPVGNGCPWCANPHFSWVPVEGKGEVYSFTEITHAIQPGFQNYLPYLVLIVELDAQKGVPSKLESLRVVGNLATSNGRLASPEMVKTLGIGTRVRMVFRTITTEFAIPQWTLDDASNQPEKVWRFKN